MLRKPRPQKVVKGDLPAALVEEQRMRVVRLTREVVQHVVRLAAGPELATYAREEACGGVELAVQRRALVLLVHGSVGAVVYLMAKELIHGGRRLGGEIAVKLGVARAEQKAGEAVARAPGVRRNL